MIVVAYVRVSTSEQADHGAGLAAQLAAISGFVASRGWELGRVYDDEASGRSLSGRPGLAAALEAVGSGEAEGLVVAKLDRVTRSLIDLAGLLERSHREGWALSAVDLTVDTTTPHGEMVAHMLGVFAQFERRLIGQRTKEALAVRRGQGVRLGRPPVLAEEVRLRIRGEREAGRTLRAIASQLTADGVPTAHGAAGWSAETVRRISSAG